MEVVEFVCVKMWIKVCGKLRFAVQKEDWVTHRERLSCKYKPIRNTASCDTSLTGMQLTSSLKKKKDFFFFLNIICSEVCFIDIMIISSFTLLIWLKETVSVHLHWHVVLFLYTQGCSCYL